MKERMYMVLCIRFWGGVKDSEVKIIESTYKSFHRSFTLPFSPGLGSVIFSLVWTRKNDLRQDNKSDE